MDIKEYALNILSEHGCDIHTYGDYPVSCDELESDLRNVYPNGMRFDYTDVAKAILEISKPSWFNIPVNGFSFNEWGKWSVYDLYDNARQELEDALNAGTPFNTGWHGCNKELQEMRIVRDSEKTIVECATYMDSALETSDLIYDCLVDDEESLLTDDKIEDIRMLLIDGGSFTEEETSIKCLPLGASIDDILGASEEILADNDNSLKESFRECIECTLVTLYGRSDETMRLIEDRISKLCPRND